MMKFIFCSIYFIMMIIGMSYSITFYLFSILIFFFCLDPFMFWILMEINLLFFIFLSFNFNLKSKFYEKESMFFYFLIQTLASFLYLSSFYFYSSYMFYSDLMFISSLSMKLGIFPFYFWVLILKDCVSQIVFFILLSLQKVPIFLIFFSMGCIYTPPFLLLSFFFGSFMIFFSESLLEILLFSSVSSSFFVFIIFLNSISMFLTFFIVYIFSLFQIINMSSKINKNNIDKIFLFIFLCGLPPLSLFFFKICISFFIIVSSSFLIFLSFWIFSFISLLGYIKYFYMSFFNYFCPYLKIKFLFLKTFIIGCSFFNFSFFIIY